MRMGISNKITEERWKKAKVELKSPKDDETVAKKYGFGRVTAMRIRNTESYYEYCAKNTTGKNRRLALKSSLVDCKEEPATPTKIGIAENMNESIAVRILLFICVMTAFMLVAISAIVTLLMIGGKG